MLYSLADRSGIIRSGNMEKHTERVGGVLVTIRHAFNILGCASLAANVGLSWWAVHLNKERIRLTAELHGPSVGPLTIKRVGPLRVTNSRGEAAVIDYLASTRPTVLYVLAPNCKWCARNEENIRFLAKSYSDTYRFVGVSVSRSGLKDFDGRYPFPIYNVAPVDLAAYGVQGTPTTIIIDPKGVLKKRWNGAYQDGALKEIQGWFHATLPGLSEAGSAPTGGSASTPFLAR